LFDSNEQKKTTPIIISEFKCNTKLSTERLHS